jgi:hypothetical protein
VHLAPCQVWKSLTLWPLVLRGDAPCGQDEELAYTTLVDGLVAGTLHVDEVDSGGSVPHVRVRNDGELPVLFLFGEEIRGAKQNRVANASFLVPERSEVVIDVSCVEAGRWARRPGTPFQAARQVVSQALRRKMAAKVSAARARGRGFEADQGEVWDEIDARIERAGARSDSRAYADYQATRAADLDEIAAAFRPVEGQVGFVACIGGEVAGLEVIGRNEVFREQFHALLRAYAIDAVDAPLLRELEREREEAAARFAAPEPFLAALARASCSQSPSLGAGEDVRLGGDEVGGCALVHGSGSLVQLTAFPAQG